MKTSDSDNDDLTNIQEPIESEANDKFINETNNLDDDIYKY